MAASSLVLVSIGNTRTRAAIVRDDKLEPSQVHANSDPGALADAIAAMGRSGDTADSDDRPTTIIASVNAPVSDALEPLLQSRGLRVLRFGRDLPIPIVNTLSDDSTVGQDRLLDALGAFARSGQACIVIDAGTAVTVDFVDGQGTFHGGAIAPGVHMMARALHQHTAALPLVELTRDALPKAATPEGGADSAHPPFGKSTQQAIAVGIASAVRGLAHHLIDRYAEFYEAYPRVVATGGDAPLLFENDPLVETIVPDLTLIGMLEAVKRLEELDSAENTDAE